MRVRECVCMSQGERERKRADSAPYCSKKNNNKPAFEHRGFIEADKAEAVIFQSSTRGSQIPFPCPESAGVDERKQQKKKKRGGGVESEGENKECNRREEAEVRERTDMHQDTAGEPTEGGRPPPPSPPPSMHTSGRWAGPRSAWPFRCHWPARRAACPRTAPSSSSPGPAA